MEVLLEVTHSSGDRIYTCEKMTTNLPITDIFFFIISSMWRFIEKDSKKSHFLNKIG